jgi:hypothetical protein
MGKRHVLIRHLKVLAIGAAALAFDRNPVALLGIHFIFPLP